MATKELSTQQITAIIGMKESQFCLLANKEQNHFPAPIRIGGVTGKTRFYDRTQVMEWISEWRIKKAAKKPIGNLMRQFLCGKFDREGLKKDYASKASSARKNKPKTQKIHVKADYESIQWPKNNWQGLI